MSGKRLDKPQKKAWTTSKVIAIGVLVMDAVATLAVLALCGLAIVRRFDGALPYLTTLIGALQAVTGVVLGAYFSKSKATYIGRFSQGLCDDATGEATLKLGNGDIYKYDKESGKFLLLSKYDSFCDGLSLVKTYIYGTERVLLDEKNSRDLIYLLKDGHGKYYIRQNNKVVNKNCPFDNVYVKKEICESENRLICTVDDISDIYEGYGKFRFNTLDIDGVGAQERLWFDKD